MAITSRGKATVNGVPGTFNVILYPIQQKYGMTQSWEEETGMDVSGGIAWLLARNEKGDLDLGVKFVDKSSVTLLANAIIPISTASSGLANSTLGQPFLAPYASVTISGVVSAGGMAAIEGLYQCISGTKFDAEGNKVSDGDYKLRKWADSTQNTLLNTVPG